MTNNNKQGHSKNIHNKNNKRNNNNNTTTTATTTTNNNNINNNINSFRSLRLIFIDHNQI